jgi:hypothetical protein
MEFLMSGFSDYWENEVLDHLFGKGTYAPPVLYVALSTADPRDDGTGVAEPTGGSYARVATAAGDWTAASQGRVCNADIVTFTQATAPWSTITHFALYDADLGGHLLASGPLADPCPVAQGDILRFAPADFNVTLE